YGSKRPPGPTEFSNFSSLVVNSNPSGAEIYMNGINTGKITPARIQVPADAPFAIKLRLERYIDYQKGNLTTDITGSNFTATLQKAMVGYIDVDVRPPLNTKVYINGKEIREE